jgi:MerR family transcriptional regulator, light-induced transcriptional regulator
MMDGSTVMDGMLMTAARDFTSPVEAPLSYRRYWHALYRRDVALAQAMVDRALREWSPQRIYLRLFQPALGMSGTLFQDGKITWQDEHFVTHHTVRFMRQVRRRFVPMETFGPLALATGVLQESHMIGLRMVCDFLQWANWRIHWLSSNERGTLANAVDRLRPDAVLLSLGLDTSVRPAGRLIDALRRQQYGGVVAVGGGAVNRRPEIAAELGADLTAPDALEFLKRVGRRGSALRSRPERTAARPDVQ